MKAVRCPAFGESEVIDVPRPTPDSEEVLIEVSRVQLSVTECQIYRGREIGSYDAVADAIENGDGRVFGHEFCGTVIESGEAVDDFETGDRVYAPAKIACGDCAYCEAGYRQLCENKETTGMGRPGALAEYVALPTEPLARLPDGISDAEGAAMQPLASALLCVEDADISTGDVVAVVGCGVMGYQCGQLAIQQGASEVIAVDVDPAKLEYATERGMETVDARENDPVSAVIESTGGIGADVVFEAVGGQQSHATTGDEPLAQSFEMVRSGGTVCGVGILVEELPLDPRVLRKNSIDWIHPRFGAWSIGPNGHTGDVAPKLVADGRVSISEFITHELDGLDKFEEAVEITSNKTDYDALGPAQIVLE